MQKYKHKDSFGCLDSHNLQNKDCSNYQINYNMQNEKQTIWFKMLVMCGENIGWKYVQLNEFINGKMIIFYVFNQISKHRQYYIIFFFISLFVLVLLFIFVCMKL